MFYQIGGARDSVRAIMLTTVSIRPTANFWQALVLHCGEAGISVSAGGG